MRYKQLEDYKREISEFKRIANYIKRNKEMIEKQVEGWIKDNPNKLLLVVNVSTEDYENGRDLILYDVCFKYMDTHQKPTIICSLEDNENYDWDKCSKFRNVFEKIYRLVEEKALAKFKQEMISWFEMEINTHPNVKCLIMQISRDEREKFEDILRAYILIEYCKNHNGCPQVFFQFLD